MFEPLPGMIRAERERQQLSQLAVANMAGLSRQSIIAVEGGEDNISMGVLVRVARALRITRLQIGELVVDGGTPEQTVLLVARDAIAAAERLTERVADQSANTREELGKHSRAISELLDRASDPAHVPDLGVRNARTKPAAKSAPRKQGR